MKSKISRIERINLSSWPGVILQNSMIGIPISIHFDSKIVTPLFGDGLIEFEEGRSGPSSARWPSF